MRHGIIRSADGDADLVAIRALFEEYARWVGIDLSFQDFDAEVAALPGAYAAPDGCLLLATIADRPVGCIGVRRLGPDGCEMKRLYVRSEARGRGVGRALAVAAIAFARRAGYRAMRLDTLPNMTAAQALYRALGFREISPYRYNPVAGTSFMELALGHDVAKTPPFIFAAAKLWIFARGILSHPLGRPFSKR